MLVFADPGVYLQYFRSTCSGRANGPAAAGRPSSGSRRAAPAWKSAPAANQLPGQLQRANAVLQERRAQAGERRVGGGLARRGHAPAQVRQHSVPPGKRDQEIGIGVQQARRGRLRAAPRQRPRAADHDALLRAQRRRGKDLLGIELPRPYARHVSRVVAGTKVSGRPGTAVRRGIASMAK
jgi:hypothetical protein